MSTAMKKKTDTHIKETASSQTNIINFDKEKISHLENKLFAIKETKLNKIQKTFQSAFPIDELSKKEKKPKRKRSKKKK